MATDGSIIWKLNKVLQGLVKASGLFQTQLIGVIVHELGFVQSASQPTLLWHEERKLWMVVHVDDPWLVGEMIEVLKLYSELETLLTARKMPSFRSNQASLFPERLYWCYRREEHMPSAVELGHMEDGNWMCHQCSGIQARQVDSPSWTSETIGVRQVH